MLDNPVMDEKKYIPRSLTKRLLSALEYFPSVVLVGARQVGKSTLLRKIFPNYSYVLFDPYEDVENARQDPDLFLRNRSTPLILDEVQYAPEVVSAIKRRIDQDRKPGQYILTGSQQWGVMKLMSETLAGRNVILQLEPFSLAELGLQPSLGWLEEWFNSFEQFKQNLSLLKLPRGTYEQLWRGFFPEAQTLPLEFVQAFHNSYQKSYLEKDIRLLASIPDLHQFTRFIRYVAVMSGKEINYHELGRDLAIANTTAKRWLTLLQEIFEWHEIPAFSANTVKKISGKPKGYCVDTGQICFCAAITSPNLLSTHPIWGSLFETAVVNEIRKQLLWMTKPCNIYHWRSHAGAECDLILERDGVFYPMEIKAKSHPSRADAQGITAFRKSYPHLNIAKGLVICLSETFYQLTEEDYALPWHVLITP